MIAKWGFLLMLGVTIIVLILALASPIKIFTDGAMNATSGDTLGMDCSNTTGISTFTRGACQVVDLTIFYFVGGIIFIAGAIILARKVVIREG